MDLEERVEKLTKETMAFRKEMLIMKALIKQQNGMIKDLIEVNHQALRVVNARRYSCSQSGIIFPLSSQQDLDNFESSVNDTNRDQIISEVMRIVGTSTLAKQIDKIFSQKLILAYNIDGHQNKKRLLDYPNFIDVLFKATMKEGWTHNDFRDELRKGLRLCKNRHFGSVCMKKKKQRMNNNGNDIDDSTGNDDPLLVAKKGN